MREGGREDEKGREEGKEQRREGGREREGGRGGAKGGGGGFDGKLGEAGRTIKPSDVAALQEGGGPGPLRTDDGSNQARFDGAPGRVKVLARLLGPAVAVLQPDQQSGEKGKDSAKAQANRPANAHRQGRGVAGAVPSLGVAHGQRVIGETRRRVSCVGGRQVGAWVAWCVSEAWV